MERRQLPDNLVPSPSDIPRYFIFAAKLEVISGHWLAFPNYSPEIRLQSKTAPRPVLLRPRHHLLLLLTKVPAAQSEGEEVVLVEVAEDLPPQLRRKLVQAPSVRDFLRFSSFFGRRAPGPEA